MSNPGKPRRTKKSGKLTDVFTHLVPSDAVADGNTVQKLFSALSESFAPQDILEEIWLHDVARITSSIEIFRVIERSVQYQSLVSRLDYLVKIRSIPESLRDFAHTDLYELTLGVAGGSKMPNGVAIEVAGSLNDSEISKVASIADIIQKLQRERDRIYAQFDRKRRPLVIASVNKVETQADKPSLVDTLPD